MAAQSVDTLPACRDLLHGYSYLELPDLSADRAPLDQLYISRRTISFSTDISTVAAAVARVLGVYCGAPDVLVAVQTTETPFITFVRVSWDDGLTWEQCVKKLAHHLHNQRDTTVGTADIRRALDLSEKQSPCMAFIGSTQEPSTNTTEYPLIFLVDASNRQLSLSASLKSVHSSVLSQMLAQVVALMEHAAKYPTFPVSIFAPLESDLVSAYERVSEEELSTIYPHISTVRLAFDYLARRATQSPHATAVCWYPDLSLDDSGLRYESMSYDELHRKSNQLARWLIQKGLVAEGRVAICMQRDLSFHIAMMGIMKSGGCYVPIDPELPVERKTYIAKDADAQFVLTSTDISPASLFESSTVYLNEEPNRTAILQQNDADLDVASPDGLAFLLYTSGTTGNPKGCLLTHRGLAQALHALSSTAANVRMDDITQGRYLAVASIAFDVHLAETIVPMALGMPLLSAPRSQLLECLPLYVKMLGVTHLGIVPSLIEATMNAVQDDDDGTHMALRYIASGGEKMSDSILDKWANHPQVRLSNFYGPSEATIGCCARFMDYATPRANIGRPFANVSGYVVDGDMSILPRGGIGELVVEGPLVGRGYHGRPDLTNKVFMEWPRKGCWSYRTGDLVRMMPDSTIEILGRIDTQIKLRGVRIESEGVSAIIRKATTQLNLTLDATTVLAKHLSIGSDQLVSFFTWDSSVPVSTRKSIKPSVIAAPKGLLKAIRTVCDAELASYMRPSHLIPLDFLPLSSNGKVDVKLLVGLFTSLDIETLVGLLTPDEEKQESRPASKVEERIFEVLKQHTTLLFDTARPNINLFECGLDSIAIIRFVSDLRSVFDQRISASDIMKSPTLAGIASLLERLSCASVIPADSFVKWFSRRWTEEVNSAYLSDDVEDILPPFTVQEGVLSRTADDNTLYVQHVLLHCKQDVSLPRIRQAWDEVMARYSILRTVFHIGRTLAQVILKPEVSNLPWTEKTTAIHNPAEFSRWFLTNKALPITKNINDEISRVPPFRISIYASAGDTFLVFSIHHALYDGISLPILIGDVERVYTGFGPRSQASLPAILDHIATIDLAAAQTFWTSYFDGFQWPIQQLASDTPSESRRLVVPFTRSLSSLKGLATSEKVTLQALLTCTFAKLLSTRIYHSEDVAFGIIRSGRLLPVDNVEGALCPMISIVPFRVDFSGSESALAAAQRSISEIIEHEHVPLGRVQNWIRPGEALFETLFSVSINASSKSDIWDVIESEPPEPDYSLSVEVVINQKDDSLLVQAAWRNGNLDDVGVSAVINDFESTALQFVGGVLNSAEITVKPTALTSRSEVQLKQSDPDEKEADVDPTLLLQIQDIVAEFIGIERRIMLPTTSFISMGLDSIKSVGLTRTLRKHGYKVSSPELMKHATPNRLAQLLSSREASEYRSVGTELYISTLEDLRKHLLTADLRLNPEDQVEVFPTTTLQAGMLSQTVNSSGELYLHVFPMQLSEAIDIKRLRGAWTETIRVLSILRTSFHFIPDTGVWVQAVHSPSALEWPVHRFKSSKEYEEKLSALLLNIRLNDEHSFERPPIWIHIFNPELSGIGLPSRLVLVMHHALYDGISIGKLLFTVKLIYDGLIAPSATQFVDILPHFIYQEKVGTSFWVSRLRDHVFSHLPRRSTNALVIIHTAIECVDLDARQIDAVLKRYAVTSQCLAQAAWAKFLSTQTNSLDVIFGQVVSGRSIPGAEDVIGPVLNTIPCRVQIGKHMRNIDVLRSIHDANVDVMPWQQASLRSIHKELCSESLWDSLFLFQPEEISENTEGNLWSMEIPVAHETKVQYPINLEVRQHASGFTLECACHSDYFDAEELAVLLRRVSLFLRNIVTHPNAPALDDMPSVTGSPQTNAMDKPAETPISRPHQDIPASIRMLLAIITKVQADFITSETPLAALGIDSITAIQMVGRFRRDGMRLSASDVVSSRTVGDMVAKIAEINGHSTNGKEVSVDINISSLERKEILSRFAGTSTIDRITIASPGMKWLVAAFQRSQRSRFQHAFAYRLPDDVDSDKLKASWLKLVQRHPILRTTFATAPTHSQPRIVIFKSMHDDSVWSQEAAKDDVLSAVFSKMKELVSNPPTSKEPPTKAIFLPSPQGRYMILYLNHFQYDAWSLQLLLHDLTSIYRGLEPCSSNDMSPFLEFSVNPAHATIQERYWKRVFPTVLEPTLFPVLTSPKATESLSSLERIIVTVEDAISSSQICEQRARELEVSLQAIFLACWARVQNTYTCSGSATFGLWQAGRTGLVDDIARLAMPCMNVLPVNVPDVASVGVIELAKRIQDDLRVRSSVIEQSDLESIHQWIGAPAKPLYNVFVNIVRVAPDLRGQESLLELIEVPYLVPDVPPAEIDTVIDRLPMTGLIQDDLFIDIATLPKKDTVLMSIDAAAHLIGVAQAEEIIRRWGDTVKDTLSLH
ncbi:peptide synthetase [Crucibulum laeve]|uniref:Peptide synthetase n=1 Tax=Crucibulum laeve TaxID=68775 RepID=A0A5C3MCP6_9AGAR|nr:peptide synthetase [Crucibulum laeve]